MRGYYDMMRERINDKSCIESEYEEIALEEARDREMEVLIEKARLNKLEDEMAYMEEKEWKRNHAQYVSSFLMGMGIMLSLLMTVCVVIIAID